jgi:hypothetical protein
MVIENDGVLIQMEFQAYLITLKFVGQDVMKSLQLMTYKGQTVLTKTKDKLY